MIEQVVTIAAGQDGIDYAWWRPTVDELGLWHFVVRYFCKLPNGKAATGAEVDTIHAAGCAFLAVWEQGAADWQQGSPRGVEHGRLAVAFAKSIGYPPGLPILFAFDSNATAGDSRARAYGVAAADAVNLSGYGFGIYGDLDVIRVLQDRSELNWLAGARAWSSRPPRYRPEDEPDYQLVHVRQVIDGSSVNYDRNVALRPFPAWLPHEATPPIEVQPAPSTVEAIPNTEEEPMRFIADSKTLGSALVECVIGNDGVPHHTMRGFDVDGAAERAVWLAAGLTAVPYSDADYQALATAKVAG